MRGLLPWCLEQICHHKIAEESDEWEFMMEVSFFKIYNNTLKDLLGDKSQCGKKVEKSDSYSC